MLIAEIENTKKSVKVFVIKINDCKYRAKIYFGDNQIGYFYVKSKSFPDRAAAVNYAYEVIANKH